MYIFLTIFILFSHGFLSNTWLDIHKANGSGNCSHCGISDSEENKYTADNSEYSYYVGEYFYYVGGCWIVERCYSCLINMYALSYQPYNNNVLNKFKKLLKKFFIKFFFKKLCTKYACQHYKKDKNIMASFWYLHK